MAVIKRLFNDLSEVVEARGCAFLEDGKVRWEGVKPIASRDDFTLYADCKLGRNELS